MQIKNVLKWNTDSSCQTHYPKKANCHSLNCWLMRPEHSVSYKKYLSSRSALPHLLLRQLRAQVTPLVTLRKSLTVFVHWNCCTRMVTLVFYSSSKMLRTQHKLYICSPISNTGSMNSCSIVPEAESNEVKQEFVCLFQYWKTTIWH